MNICIYPSRANTPIFGCFGIGLRVATETTANKRETPIHLGCNAVNISNRTIQRSSDKRYFTRRHTSKLANNDI